MASLAAGKKAPERFILTEKRVKDVVKRTCIEPTREKPWPDSDPRVDALVTELIGRVADKWTMLILETLAEHEYLRFTQIGRLVKGISQKMLTQTLRQMERDGLVVRKVHPVIPPRVDYSLPDLGISLGEAFCGVWIWAEENLSRIEGARADYDGRKADSPG